VRDAGHVRHAEYRQLGLVAIEGNTRDRWCLPWRVLLEADQRARPVLKAVQHAQGHVVLAGELDGTNLQHLRAHAGHLEHFLEGDAVEAPGTVDDARIRRVHAVHVGVDLALVGFQAPRPARRPSYPNRRARAW
jgi:hypothetical protein